MGAPLTRCHVCSDSLSEVARGVARSCRRHPSQPVSAATREATPPARTSAALRERVGPGATATLARRPSERPLRRPCRSEADPPCSSLRYALSLAAPRPPRRHAPPGPRLLERRAETLGVPPRRPGARGPAHHGSDPRSGLCRESRRRALKRGRALRGPRGACASRPRTPRPRASRSRAAGSASRSARPRRPRRASPAGRPRLRRPAASPAPAGSPR